MVTSYFIDRIPAGAQVLGAGVGILSFIPKINQLSYIYYMEVYFEY